MNDCLSCKHSYIEDIWKSPVCRLKNHEPVSIDIFNAVGKVRLNSGMLVDCEDGVKNGD